MASVLLVIHILAAVGIIALVLMQQGRGADMGAAFGGGSQTLFGARGSSNFLSRVTGLLAAVFFTTSLTLAYIHTQGSEPQSVTDQVTGSSLQSPDQGNVQDQEQGDMPQVPSADAAQEPVSDVPSVPEPANE